MSNETIRFERLKAPNWGDGELFFSKDDFNLDPDLGWNLNSKSDLDLDLDLDSDRDLDVDLDRDLDLDLDLDLDRDLELDLHLDSEVGFVLRLSEVLVDESTWIVRLETA